MCRVVGEGVGRVFGGYQPGVYVPLKALFLVFNLQAAQCSYFSYFFPIFSGLPIFFLYFDPKSYIFPSNSYIFQNTADNNEISRKNHGILV